MKRIAEKIILLTTLVFLFMACNPEIEDTSEKTITSLQVTLNGFSGRADTRTQETGYQTSFTGNERIGVFALKNSGNTILENNIPYKRSAGTWQPVNTNNQIHVYGSGITYYAYYPYSSSMDGKKSIAEIISAFTPPEDQSDHDKYTSADLMTGTGTLGSGSTLAFSFAHAMSLIEIKINETSNSDAPYDPAPVFYGMKPWKMPDGVYRYLIRPGVDTEVAFDYGPADNRYAYQKSLAAADVTAGKYTRITAPFDNRYLELNTGNYGGILGSVSKVVINGTEYSTSLISGSNNRYLLDNLRKSPESFTSFSIYITDNLAKAGSKEQLLLAVTTSNITIDATNKSLTVPLSAGGMEGAGTSADPYLVTTPPQLRGVNAEGADSNSAETEYYEQKADLNLSAYDNWKPVKSGALYDGKGYGVNNLVSTQGGIFSYNGGTIQNVHLVSGDINSTSGTIGGIVNTCDKSGINQTILNCSNAANITAGGWGGGIVGNGSYSTIEHCKNSGIISSTVAVGGIFGHIWGDAHVRYCYNEGLIKVIGSGSDNPVGGIGGQIYASAYGIEYSYNKGDVQNDVTGEAGSILGRKSSGDGSNNYGIPIFNNKIYGSNNNSSTEVLFNDSSNIWPAYTTDSSNGWGSSHWKSYVQGEYPKLPWEP